MSDTAGFDRIRLAGVRRIPPTRLALLFNAMLYLGATPTPLRACRTTLIPKGKDDPPDVNNWRPITVATRYWYGFSTASWPRGSSPCLSAPRSENLSLPTTPSRTFFFYKPRSSRVAKLFVCIKSSLLIYGKPSIPCLTPRLLALSGVSHAG